jgi:hypothetical protein
MAALYSLRGEFDTPTCAGNPGGRHRGPMQIPEYFTTQEVAAILKVSTETVIRRFQHCPGVIDLGSSEKRLSARPALPHGRGKSNITQARAYLFFAIQLILTFPSAKPVPCCR